MQRSRLSPSGLVLLALVTLGWGLVWPINKVVLADVPPLTFRGTCLVAGGIGVLALARLSGQSLSVPRRYWRPVLALSVFNIIAWNVLVIYGVSLLPSGRAALLGYTMPVWSTPLSVWLLGERLNARRSGSLVLGMGGVLVLIGGDLTAMASATNGVVLMLAAAMSWALGVVLLRRFALPIPTGTLTGWMMLVASVPIATAAVIFEHDQWRPVSGVAALGLLYCILIAFMFCYYAWNRLVLMVPVTVASISALATPVVGVASGIWLLDEPLTWQEITAGICIVGAIALVLGPREPDAAAEPDEPDEPDERDGRVDALTRPATRGADTG